MADSKREIERKYEATVDTRLPELTRVAGVAVVDHRGVMELDAVYYDTEDQRLAADSLTLRRRTGGDDAGWHLKFPVAHGIRDEIRAPLSDTLPPSLAALLRSRVRETELVPVVRLHSSRDVHHLLGPDGSLLAELSVDEVRAVRLAGGSGTAAWTEIEVELADDGDPAFLDAVEHRLRKAGVKPSASASKLARALAETAPRSETVPKKQRTAKKTAPRPRTAGDHVMEYVRDQITAVVALDPAVRRDLPDSVHQMRVATRRLRSAFRTYRKILDRTVTDPVGDELKWLAAELGIDRDQEVLDERLRARIADLPRTLVLGPVRSRLGSGPWPAGRLPAPDRRRTRRQALPGPPGKPRRTPGRAAAAARCGPRPRGRTAPRRAAGLRAPRHPYRPRPGTPARPRPRPRHARRPQGGETRPVRGEAATAALGRPAKKFARRMKAVQTVLGDHQDSVVARDALRTLAAQAHAAGETAFTWGLLYGHEEATAAAREQELPEVWERASRPKLRAALEG